MRLTFALLMLGLAGACSGDDYPPPSGGDKDAAPPDGPGADADPLAPDADPSAPDADPLAPDAGPTDATQTNDRKGPVIEVSSPDAELRLLSGTMVLTFTAVDDDGVNLASVGASIRGAGVDPIAFADLAPSGANQWTGTFDTRMLAGRVFPVVLIVAADNAGNETEYGFTIAIDNVPPVAELDPPRIREWRRNTTGGVECSRSFDPVGSDAPSDGESVAQFIELRARIQDLPNSGTRTSNVVLPLAGVDVTRVELLVLDDSAVPLVVDTNGDRKCDAVNPDIVPRRVPTASNEAALVNLSPLEAAGGGVFPTAAQSDDPLVGDNLAVCGFTATAVIPELLCDAADDVFRIPGISGSGDDMIYAPPSTNAELACMGDFFDAPGANMSDGWACAVVRVTDGLGNTSVSKVLRICIDGDQNDPDATHECHAWRTIAPEASRPNCTGTVSGGVVSATPCTPLLQYAPQPPNDRPPGEYELIRLP